MRSYSVSSSHACLSAPSIGQPPIFLRVSQSLKNARLVLAGLCKSRIIFWCAMVSSDKATRYPMISGREQLNTGRPGAQMPAFFHSPDPRSSFLSTYRILSALHESVRPCAIAPHVQLLPTCSEGANASHTEICKGDSKTYLPGQDSSDLAQVQTAQLADRANSESPESGSCETWPSHCGSP